ncbi:hypothetical protein RJT34_04850 [Clitoria ternatea]|uniref:ENTH domain-containing protein n=1 Tax=Clitoria ternatea TaxID=43366 RepID=A0AAN9KNF3_CLITE
MQRRFRQVCSALKEHSYIRYAKIASASGFSDINLIIVKATSPDDMLLHEKYIQYLLNLFSMSPSSCHSFALSFTRRFGNTRSWRVALKCLILLHRLLRSVPGNSTLWTELLWTRSSALISLYPCHFRDNSSCSPVSYTNFIIAYAHLLDEALNCVSWDSTALKNQHRHQQEEEEEEEEDEGEEAAESGTFQEKMMEMGEILELLPQLQSIIDRVMDCYPVGVASRSVLVQSAMKLIIRDSFVCYTRFRREIVVVLDNLLQMPYRHCIAAFNIYKKAAVQTNHLYEFYEWCKAKGLCGFYEYPSVEPIPYIQIKALESFLSGMWQLTESSSSSSSEESSSVLGERQVAMRREVVINNKDQEFVDEEEKPLIEVELEKNEDDSWETVLESSVSFCDAYYHGDLLSFFHQQEWDSGIHDEQHNSDDHLLKIVPYKSHAATYNPFSESN